MLYNIFKYIIYFLMFIHHGPIHKKNYKFQKKITLCKNNYKSTTKWRDDI